MKHTDFYDTFMSIRHHIINEIKEAVKAHGGEYIWDDSDEYPIVAANPDCCDPEPLDVCIESVKLDEDGYLSIQDIFVEHLSYILKYMKETQEVSDVSIPFEN